MPNVDKESFLMGLQLGRRLRALETDTRRIPVTEQLIITEYGYPILTEDGDYMIMEGGD